MTMSKQISDDEIRQFLDTIDEVPKPIVELARSGEGGEHMVWIVNGVYVLRVRADGRDNELLVREEKIWDLLRSVESEFPAAPVCVKIGELDVAAKRPYGLYRKLGGVSIEASPQSVTASTEYDLARLLRLLKGVLVDQARAIGVGDEEVVDFNQLRQRALQAWGELHRGGAIDSLAEGLDINEALRLPESAAHTAHEPVLLHADIKGEHIFVNAGTGRLTGVIDWSDACIGHPSVDVHGLAISIGAAAAARVAASAGYSRDVTDRGVFTARCDSVLCLYSILYEGDDSPEWLLRRQLQRALERI